MIPNLISISRFFLAFLLFSESTGVRLCAILLGALTDFLDGFLARRFKWITPLGTVIDPLADKFFIGIGLIVFLRDGLLSLPEALLMLSRDGAVLLFALFLFGTGSLRQYSVRAIFWGKVSTALQLMVLVALLLGVLVPFWVYLLFGLFGVLSFYELYQTKLSLKKNN